MRKRAWIPASVLGLLSLLALLVALVAAMNVVGCCAIDCEKYPEKCAENRRRQESASVTLFGALAVSVAALGGAIYVVRRR